LKTIRELEAQIDLSDVTDASLADMKKELALITGRFFCIFEIGATSQQFLSRFSFKKKKNYVKRHCKCSHSNAQVLPQSSPWQEFDGRNQGG
jgi:hypothetical protein